jgi:hypothetical protein
MTPVEQVAALYDEGRSFRSDLEAYLLRGYVISTPTSFCMARAVQKGADHALIKDPYHSFDNPDTWYVFAYAGRLSEAWKNIPYPLPWVGLDRKHHGIKFYPSDLIVQKSSRF